MNIFATVVAGVAVFVIGQILLKSVIEPTQKLREAIAEVVFRLTKDHTGIYNANQGGETRVEQNEQIEENFKQLSARLVSGQQLILFYSCIHKLFSLPTKDEIKEAAKRLYTLPNQMRGEHKRDETLDRYYKEICELLHVRNPIYNDMSKEELQTMRTVIAGLAGGMAMNLVMLMTFRLIGFGWNGGGILLTSPMQSRKLIAVWTQLEPLPLVVANPAPIIIGLLLFGIGHAFVYKWLSVSWPGGIAPRALRLAGLVFFMTFLFWEFFTPFNQFGEPLPLVAIELSFWALIALAEAFAIASVMEHRSTR